MRACKVGSKARPSAWSALVSHVRIYSKWMIALPAVRSKRTCFWERRSRTQVRRSLSTRMAERTDRSGADTDRFGGGKGQQALTEVLIPPSRSLPFRQKEADRAPPLTTAWIAGRAADQSGMD